MSGFYSRVIELLKANGFYFLRTGKGSHEVWSNGSHNQIVSKNMPSRDMANTIMKQAGIRHKFA